ncbi:MAG: HD domain-containing protein [Candidatus Aenigmatarchaeota archaeon]
MDKKQIIKDIEKISKEMMAKSKAKGHDFPHVRRTRVFALKIAKSIDYDIFTIEIAALLHDIGNVIERKNHSLHSAKLSKNILNKYPISKQDKKEIIQAIKEHSQPYATTTLGKILQDADKLDAMGAIGLMRVFEFNLEKYPLYDPITPFKPRKLYKDSKGRVYFKMNELQYISDVIYIVLQFNNMLNFPISKKIGKEKTRLLKDFINIAKKELS